MSMIKQKGTSTVEFAMLVPLLLLLVIMVSEFGVMFYRLNAVSKSVQVATRYLSDISINPNLALTNSQVKNLICFGSVGGSGTEIVPECNDKLELTPLPSAAAGHITVSARYPANWILPGAVVGLLGLSDDPMALRASSVMRFTQ